MYRSLTLPLPPSSLHYDNRYTGYADYTGNRCLPWVYCFRVYRCFLYCLLFFHCVAPEWLCCIVPCRKLPSDFFCLLENTSFIYYRFITSFPAGLPTDEEAAYLSLYAMHPKTFIFNYPGYVFFSCYCYLAFFLFFQDRFYPLNLYLVPIFLNNDNYLFYSSFFPILLRNNRKG